MKKEFLATILVLTIGGWQMQEASAQTRLVVSVTIDQLRSDYINTFSPFYGSQGFIRVMREGKVYQQVQFSFDNKDRASAIAAIYTGTTPSVNGIIGSQWLDRTTGRQQNCVDDAAFMGNNTNENSSAAWLLTSTLPDELKIATNNQALVYAVSPFRDAAILSAGHAANCAFWINPETGKWCSTTYYKDFPLWLDNYNTQQGPDLRVKDKDRVNRYRRLLTTPAVNNEVNLLTEELLKQSELGAVSLFCMGAALLFSHPLIGVFIGVESSSHTYGAAFLRILCIGAPFSAWAYTVISFFQATGHMRKSLVLALLRKGILDIPLMFFLNVYYGRYGLVSATPIADVVCCITAAILFFIFLSRHGHDKNRFVVHDV